LPHYPTHFLKSKSTFAFGKSKPYGLPTFFVGALAGQKLLFSEKHSFSED
jgi:hypothetical protein